MSTETFNAQVSEDIHRMMRLAEIWDKAERSDGVPAQPRHDPDSWPTLEEQQAYNERDDTLAALEGRLRDREPNGCNDWMWEGNNYE